MTRNTRLMTAGVAVICALAVVIYLGLFDPAVAPAPQCLFHRLTGLDCPGCGTQRAIHALLNGHPGSAWHYNAAIFFALPVALLYALRPRRLRPILYATATPYLLAAATIAWWIARNLGSMLLS